MVGEVVRMVDHKLQVLEGLSDLRLVDDVSLDQGNESDNHDPVVNWSYYTTVPVEGNSGKSHDDLANHDSEGLEEASLGGGSKLIILKLTDVNLKNLVIIGFL